MRSSADLPPLLTGTGQNKIWIAKKQESKKSKRQKQMQSRGSFSLYWHKNLGCKKAKTLLAPPPSSCSQNKNWVFRKISQCNQISNPQCLQLDSTLVNTNFLIISLLPCGKSFFPIWWWSIPRTSGSVVLSRESLARILKARLKCWLPSNTIYNTKSKYKINY